jgi:hypothetical protein
VTSRRTVDGPASITASAVAVRSATSNFAEAESAKQRAVGGDYEREAVRRCAHLVEDLARPVVERAGHYVVACERPDSRPVGVSPFGR